MWQKFLNICKSLRLPNLPQICKIQATNFREHELFEINQLFIKIRNCMLWSKIVCSTRKGFTHAPADIAQVTAQLEARVRPKETAQWGLGDSHVLRSSYTRGYDAERRKRAYHHQMASWSQTLINSWGMDR